MESIDFLPERIKFQRAKRKRLIRQVYLLAVCVVTLALLAYTRQARIAKTQAQLGLLAERSKNVQRQLQMLSSLQRQQADLMIKKRIDDQLGSRANALDVLSELGRLLPRSVAIYSLDLAAVDVRVPVRSAARTEAGRATAFSQGPREKDQIVKRVRLELTGLAPTDVDVANFIGQLSASPLFEDVNMGYTKDTDFADRSARQFNVSCYIVR